MSEKTVAVETKEAAPKKINLKEVAKASVHDTIVAALTASGLSVKTDIAGMYTGAKGFTVIVEDVAVEGVEGMTDVRIDFTAPKAKVFKYDLIEKEVA